MIVLSGGLTVLVALVGLIWSTRHVKISREANRLVLTPEYPGPPEEAPFISVVVAAKDEADCIDPCIRTMLEQDYPNFEIVVCNDRSEDQTPEIVEQIANEDPRLRLINIEHLPDGWKGKNNAMQTGIASTQGDWICMIDADCRQLSNRTLSVAMQYALDQNTTFLSVLPRHELLTFWENVVQPVGTGVMMIWFNPDMVNDPRKSHAYANGAFMLMTRRTYEQIGTHEAVKNCLNEDMHMAARAKSSGINLRVVRSRDLEIVRMYTTLGDMLRGWSRIFLGTFGTLKRLTISLGLLVVMGFFPYVAGVLGLVLGASGVQPVTWWWVCGCIGLAAVAIQGSVIFRFYHLIEARKGLFWTYPMGCVVIMLGLIRALTKLRKGARVTWKNTSYAKK